MDTTINRWLANLFCCISLPCWITLATLPIQAQVTPDQTLPSPSTANLNGNQFAITGGTRAGTNLFHSFREFSVPTGGAASFQQVDPAITNIITRVTGVSASRIDGAIEALQAGGQVSSANLFLINPNGILFGANASLNLGGSFLATTGDRLNFADGTQFRADGTQSSPLLTISAPVGLQFGVTPGAIVNHSRHNLRFSNDLLNDAIAGGLQVPRDQTLALVGGDVRLPGGVLVAEGGRIELGAIGNSSQALVRLTSDDRGWRLGYENINSFQNLQFSQGANVSVSGSGGGSVQIQGDQIDLTGQSFITSVTRGDSNGELIHIRADRLDVGDRSLIRSFTQGAGVGSNVVVAVDRLNIESGGQIAVNTNASGNSGNIQINATDAITLDGGDDVRGGTLFGTGLFSQARSQASGNGGQLEISTRTLNIREGAQVNAPTFGAGDGGSIRIHAASIDLVGTARDEAGEIIYTPPPQAQRPYPSGLFTGTRNRASGNGGLLQIETERLSLRDGAAIKTNTEGSGNSGSLNIHATEQIEVIGRVSNSSLPSFILTASGGVAGIDDSGVNDATGRSGTLRIRTRDLRVEDGGAIAVSSSNPNEQVAAGAGNLRIRASTVSLATQGRLLADTASGDGGNIRLSLDHFLLLRNDSQISTTAGTEQTGGNGGDISIQANFIAAPAAANSDITANAFTGTGGNINVTAQGILGIQPRSQQTELSDITASSTFGRSGTIEIDAAEVDPKRALISLPTDFFSARLDQRCQMGSGGAGSFSRFVYTGQGGLSPSPQEADVGDLWQDWRLPTAGSDRPAQRLSSSPPEDTVSRSSRSIPLVEAQGWIFDPQRQIQLVAQAPTITSYSSWQTPGRCYAHQ
ncbi:filamentous hemagglutinin N-terminal domain-containing protein [Phormidium tenue FACHB-886]|nr:filamentous hemagglutinin N-terminal domain-containing protein [Phormidium tenue FACHB-886]